MDRRVRLGVLTRQLASTFKGVPLSYQEARIYHWNQAADKIVAIDNIPQELRVEQVIGDQWIYPNDPRLKQVR